MTRTSEEMIGDSRAAGRLDENEADLITSYLEWRRSQGAEGDAWIANLCSMLIRSSDLLHDRRHIPWQECRTSDIHNVITGVKGGKFRPNYKRQMVHAVRGFGIWLAKEKRAGEIDAEDLRTVKLPKAQWKTKRPEDMLTQEEITALLPHCRSVRDRCLITMLWDASSRPIELLSLKWCDVHFDDFGAYFQTSQKTGKERRIRLTFSLPYIKQWKEKYPGKPDGEAPVFVTTNLCNGKHIPMTKDNLDRVIRYLKAKTGIRKLKPSIFRPSRITHDVKSGYDLPYVMLKNWGSLKTPMIDLYTNVDADYIDQEALRKAGMDRKKESPRPTAHPLETGVCPICADPYLMGMRYCATCGASLTEQAAADLVDIDKIIDANPKAYIKALMRRDPGLKTEILKEIQAA